MLGSSFALVYGICAPFAGNIVDRVRRKSAVLGGLFAWSIICSATAISRNFIQLLFFRAAEGLGETFYFPAAMSMISDYHGKRTRSRAMGTHQTSVYAGTIAGGFLGGLIAQHYGWRSSFVVFGVARRDARIRSDETAGGACARGRRPRGFRRSRAQRCDEDAHWRISEGHLDHSHGAVAHDRVHARQLRRNGSADLDAEVSLRQISLEPGGRGIDRDTFHSTREHGWDRPSAGGSRIRCGGALQAAASQCR